MTKMNATFVLLFLLILEFALPMGSASILDILGPLPDAPSKKYNVQFVEGDEDAETEVLLIRIRGVITDEESDRPFPLDVKLSMMERFQKELDLAMNREEVKAVLVEINSPGGEVTASDIIHHGLSKLKVKKKPVVALIGVLGASGAYYVACAADKILAHPTSIIGSIGVLMQTANLEQLARMIGYKSVTLKSEKTPKKDMLSPFRELSEDEKQMLLSIINAMYDRFVEIVAKARNKSVAEVTKLADGGIYTAQQALEGGLVDAVGYREDALAETKKLLQVETLKLVKRKVHRGFAEILKDITSMKSDLPALLSGLQGLLRSESVPSFRYQLQLPGSR